MFPPQRRNKTDHLHIFLLQIPYPAEQDYSLFLKGAEKNGYLKAFLCMAQVKVLSRLERWKSPH